MICLQLIVDWYCKSETNMKFVNLNIEWENINFDSAFQFNVWKVNATLSTIHLSRRLLYSSWYVQMNKATINEMKCSKSKIFILTHQCVSHLHCHIKSQTEQKPIIFVLKCMLMIFYEYFFKRYTTPPKEPF